MAIYVEPERPDFWQLAKDSTGKYIDPWGPLDCQPHSMARAIMRHYEGIRPLAITGQWPPTGGFIRSVTRNPNGSLDRDGGTNLGQMRDVAKTFYGMDLEVRYGLPWQDLIAGLRATKGVSLSVYYKPIRDSSYKGSTTFYDNHQIFIGGVDEARGVFTNVVDPLADGRYPGLYKGPGDYPIELLKRAAGMLDLDGTSKYRPLGYGLCYVGFTRQTGDAPVAKTWQFKIAAGATIRVYTLSSTGCIQSYKDQKWPTSSSAPCTAPVSRKTCSGTSSATTTRITAGYFVGKTVRAFGSGVSTELV